MSIITQKKTTENVTDNSRLIALSRRIAVGLALACLAAIHILDIPGKLTETPYIAGMYFALVVAAFVLMERLFTTGTRRDFLAAAALSTSVLLGFVINRTVGMPGAMDDIGNWLEPLGLVSLVVETFIVWQAIAAVVEMTRTTR